MDLFKLVGTIAISNDEANKALDDTTSKAKLTHEAVEKIRTGAVKVGTALTGFAGVIGGAFYSSVENTREYREQMNMLTTAFSASGHSAESARHTYSKLNGVLGDSGQAVEAANHIAKLVTNTKDMQVWTDICTGVWATFGESLPIEGLTEAANETAKVGQVVGPLADALNWMGVSEDEFNEKLKGMSSEQERQQLIMETLNESYKTASDQYKENNKDIIAAYEAQDKMTAAVANFGAIGEPILTTMQNKLADIVNVSFKWISENGEAVGAALTVIASGIAIGAIAAHPYAAAIVAIAAGLAWLTNEEGKRKMNQDHFFDGHSQESLEALQEWVEAKRALKEADDTFRMGMSDEEYYALVDAADAAAQKVNEMDGELMGLYESWRTNQENGFEYLDVPLQIKEGTESAFQAEINNMTLEGVVKLYADTSGLSPELYKIAGVDGSHASGLDYVPRDNYIARLHKGEAVLTANEASTWRNGEDISSAVRNAVSGLQIVLDSGVLVGQLAPKMDAQFGTLASRKGRGN